MNVKVSITDIYYTLKGYNYDEVYNALLSTLGQDDFIFARRSVGKDYWQWTLSDEEWRCLSEADFMEQGRVESLINSYKQQGSEKLRAVGLTDNLIDKIFSTPDDKFIYYKVDSAGNYQIQLTAWGYKYPDRHSYSDSKYTLPKDTKQEVCLSFVHAGVAVPSRDFIIGIDKLHKRLNTGANGKLMLGKIEPGKCFAITDTVSDKQFMLVVEQGKTEYIFDVTDKTRIVIRVMLDGTPKSGELCKVTYLSNLHLPVTDVQGCSTLLLPFNQGELCKVEVGDKTEELEIAFPETTFIFEDFTPEIIEDVSEEVPPGPTVVAKPTVIPDDVKIAVRVIDGLSPLQGKKCNLKVGDCDFGGYTDDKGGYTITLPYTDSTNCTATVENIMQSVILRKPVTEFLFDLHIDKPMRDFTPHIKIEGKDGFIGKLYPITVELNNVSSSYISDENGIVQLGMVSEGEQMRVVDDYNSENEQVFMLDADQEEYIFQVPYTPCSNTQDIKIIVQDANSKPIRQGSVNFSQEGRGDILSYLNDEGTLWLSNDNFEFDKLLVATLTVEDRDFEPVNFTLEQNQKEYLLQVEGKGTNIWTRIAEALLAVGSVITLLIIINFFSNIVLR